MPRIAVAIPCYNERLTVEKVVSDFREALPSATVYVYDNNSTDGTAEAARRAGAVVRRVTRQGKGNVVRRMFADIDADIYVMVDGDSTYPAQRVAALVAPVAAGEADMVVGSRAEAYASTHFRRFHRFGNELIRKLINVLFRSSLTVVLSGFRCFSRRFVKGIGVLSEGFEIETELTLQALDKNFTVMEVPIDYYDRPKGSTSKLNTYLDGLLIMQTILSVFKDYKPLKCFSSVAALAFGAAGLFGSIPIHDFVTTGGVTHQATAVLAASTALIAVLSLLTGVILDSIARRNREMYQLLVDHVIKGGEESSTPARIRPRPHARPAALAAAPAQTALR
jgi:glycosyltransferase involved in cell wall biosynthesis